MARDYTELPDSTVYGTLGTAAPEVLPEMVVEDTRLNNPGKRSACID